MIRTHIIPCRLKDHLAQSLNQASGKAYTETLVMHWRLYRKKGLWLSEKKHSRVFTTMKGETILHSQCFQSAVQDFYEACKTAKALKKTDPSARYPYKRKWYHTTTWKGQCLAKEQQTLCLPLARGHDPIEIVLPSHLESLPESAFLQVQLVYDISTKQNHWHLTVEDGQEASQATGQKVLAIDLGEIHPAACTDGVTATIISCRELRANSQHRNKKTADLQELSAHCTKGSRRWKKLTLSRKKLHAQTKKRLSRENRQKIANWPHGQLRQCVEYKAQAAGITVELINEAYTSKTCPICGHLNKPKGRTYSCASCGFVGHRDTVGSTNILSKKLHGALAQIPPPAITKYRHPFRRASVDRGDARREGPGLPVASAS